MQYARWYRPQSSPVQSVQRFTGQNLYRLWKKQGVRQYDFGIGYRNTNVVLGCIADGEILFTERMATDSGKTELDYAISLKWCWSCGKSR